METVRGNLGILTVKNYKNVYVSERYRFSDAQLRSESILQVYITRVYSYASV